MELSRIEYTHTKKKLNGATGINFKYFLQRGFLEISPSSKLYHSWYLDLIIEHLTAVANGNIKRLVINMPPRHLKSMTVNVFWSAWLLGQNPGFKVISASYSHNLSVKHSEDVRYIMNTPWYNKLFPKTKIMPGCNTKSKFTTTHQGFRLATSIGGTLTGEGGDILIVDDPHTPMQAQSRKHRNRALNWFDQTLLTRLNNPKEGSVVVVMQRLHEQDLSGHLLSKKAGWQHLNIPVFEECERSIEFNNFSYKRKAREPLNEKVCSYKALVKLKAEIGSYAFSAQYLQKPLSSQGSLLKLGWLHYYDNTKPLKFQYCFQSWDCAFKTGKNNDYSVCATFGVLDGKIYLQNILRGKFEFSDLKKVVQKKYLEYSPHSILIEDKASGQVLIQDLMNQYTLPVVKVRPKLDKFARFITNLNLFEAGVIYLPKEALWLAEFTNELLEFPNVQHDDQVDACTQFLNWWQTAQQNLMKIREI